jgi:hypothetical protein
MHFLIHNLIFTVSPTAQAPISLLLPKSTGLVVLAEYHHNRSQNLANCQSQQKRTSNQPNLLTELLPNRPFFLRTHYPLLSCLAWLHPQATLLAPMLPHECSAALKFIKRRHLDNYCHVAHAYSAVRIPKSIKIRRYS